MNHLTKKVLQVGIFAVAMGFLESAVVIYIRYIYYPEGFSFPLEPMDPKLVVTELLREAATLIMLIMIGYLSAQKGSARFGAFLIAFGVWDITYYLFLKLLINWPASLLTWDILFLLPTTWTGPVIAPVINSITMIVLGILLMRNDSRKVSIPLSRYEWTLLVTGSLVTIYGYALDYSRHMLKEFSFFETFSFGDVLVTRHAFAYVPGQFPWLLFLFGQLYFILAIIGYTLRIRKKSSNFA
jgi:hypothetical protein